MDPKLPKPATSLAAGAVGIATLLLCLALVSGGTSSRTIEGAAVAGVASTSQAAADLYAAQYRAHDAAAIYAGLCGEAQAGWDAAVLHAQLDAVSWPELLTIVATETAPGTAQAHATYAGGISRSTTLRMAAGVWCWER